MRREELGLSRAEVAEKVGITQQSYQAIEADKTQKPRFLYEISIALECEIGWLIRGNNLNNR